MRVASQDPIEVGVDATTWWNERGFGRFTRCLVGAMSRRSGRFRYTLVVDREPDTSLPAEARLLRVDVRRTVTESARGSSSRSLADMWALSRSVSRRGFGVFFFPAVYSYVPLLTRVPTVVGFHDTTAERYPELMFPTRRNHLFWKLKVAIALRQAHRVMTVSEASARDLRQFLGVAPERIDIVWEAAHPCFRPVHDPDLAHEARRRLGIPPTAPLLVYFGGLNPHKNVLGLLRAFPRVLDSHPHCVLAIVGDLSGRGFHDNAAEVGAFIEKSPRLRPNVRLTGFIADEELVVLLNAATAFVLPSLAEGFGLPAVEAMACGLPVLASNRGSLPEVVGDAGVYFDPESPSEVADAIVGLLADSPRRRRLSARALARAAEYTWDRAAEQAEASLERAWTEVAVCRPS